MKILIVGGNRFVGAEVVSRAVLDGHDVTVAALDPPNIRVRSHVRFVQANRNNPDELRAGLKGLEFDAVLDNIAFVPENIAILLEVLKDRIGRYVLTSTVDIYPREIPLINAEKDALLSPSEVKNAPRSERYLRGKRGCEKVLRSSVVPWSIIRPAIVYGRTDPIPPAPRHLCGRRKTYGRSLFFPVRVVDGGPILLRRNDRRVFSLVSSQDVARALLLVAHHQAAERRAFNVAGDEIWTSERLIQAVGHAAGKVPTVVRASDDELASAGLGDYDSPYGRVHWWSVADNRRLKLLGWSPTPADIQLTKLVETLPPVDERPFYDRRLQEIALAERIMRQRKTWAVHNKGVRPRAKENEEKGKRSGPPFPLRGKFSGEAVETWKASLYGSSIASPVSHEHYFRNFSGSEVSSIGIGTHRGDASEKTDASYHEALLCAVRGGINLIDTAINYRWMRAERTVGKVLAELENGGVSRSAICLCSKGGYVPRDADDPRSLQDYIWEEFTAPGLITMREALKRHSIKAAFIRKLLGLSLRNLGVEHIDVYFIHNPERALAGMQVDEFFDNLRNTFAMLEEAVSEGTIGCYGIATWQGLRTSPGNAHYLPLERIYSLAYQVGGTEHHFRAIQFPVNVHNTEAMVRKNQEVDGVKMPLVKAASSLGLYTFASASICRGQDLSREIIERLLSKNDGLNTVQAALNFTRSVPGIGSALVGMRRQKHVEEALAAGRHPMLSPEEVADIVA